uniref:Methylase involved in ubiquinone/menaquinone biosynthesis n=1 Tax=uncultured Chloroflexota bacterium TaxID=166587 RepID=H5SQ42_9CHLR|nr:methylase involved in ubiquinone/menaquinone biosynthesis [uncultured Chloroflexota bacterium]
MPFDESYFRTHTYANVSFARFSQYWWSNRFYAMLARRYGRRHGDLLEIGCGLGHLVGQLEPSFRTWAIDINRWALRESQRNARRTLLAHASAEELPFATASFDVVIIKHIVEHLPHPERAIAEIGRVCRPGALLILSTPNLDSLLRPLKGERWIGFQDPTHISLKPPAEWLRLIREAGFELQRVFADGFWDVPYVPLVPARLQKLFFGAPGGFQAITGLIFVPLRWGESMIVIARRKA